MTIDDSYDHPFFYDTFKSGVKKMKAITNQINLANKGGLI